MVEKREAMEANVTPQDAMENHLQRKKRKKDKTMATVDGQWERCMFKIVRKNRFCNMERVTGTLFCGNHLPDDVEIASKKSQKFKESMRKRVQCPVDGSHTVYQYDLEKHVLICNKLKEVVALKSLPYYRENINSGTHATTTSTTTNPPIEAESEEHNAPSDQQQQSLIDLLKQIDFSDLVQRIRQAYNNAVGAIPLEKLRHASCDPLLREKQEAGASKSLLRHIEQQSSILAHMNNVKLLDPKFIYIELGAGRGMLSLALAQSLPSNVYVLIDRAPTRGKADRFIAEDQETKNVIRAKIDIRHLNLQGMKELTEKPVVCMSKHLCGVATDLSLRAVTNTLERSQVCGLAVALCCHHACAWEDYVSPEFFLAQGFKPEEFHLIKSMSSWGTCGMATEGDSVERALHISRQDRAVLGRQCKRILDAGRVNYLQFCGFETRLVHYCNEEDSLENCLLLAWQNV